MYYAPNKRTDKEAIQYPAPSQIPGLGTEPPEPAPEQKQYIRDSDSTFIRLSKLGGHPSMTLSIYSKKL